jgi:outer membrane beta-barrel protein
MNKIRVGLFVAAMLCAFPASAWAQKKKPAPAEAAPDKNKAGAEAAPAGEAAPAAEGKPAEGEAAPKEGAAGAEAGGEEGPTEAELAGEGGEEELKDICKIDPAACPKIDLKGEAGRHLIEPLFAVEQRFIIKSGRFELNPFFAFTVNDQFVAHPAPGVAVNYYISEVLAIGVNGSFYRPFNVDSAFNGQVRRSARVAVPLTEYDWGAALNLTYVYADGKFAGLGDFIFNYDSYLVGGVGVLSARPIPVIDPDNRNFTFKPGVAFNAGIGLRIFFTKWFAAVLEVRDYIFQDRLENLSVAPNPQDKDTWLGDKKLTNNVQFQTGISLFIPFSFEYKLQK